MKFTFYKYQGTGNDFIIIDNREETFPIDNQIIKNICHRRFGIGADGFMLLQKDATTDFFMNYFNSDGNKSTMCGNGGRCLVRFAHDLQLIDNQTVFMASDGLHEAKITPETISLKMMDVKCAQEFDDHYFVNTGSPHHVEFVEEIQEIDVLAKGRAIRNSDLYEPEGANVNFVEKIDEKSIWVRTYERGVEDETHSCGTGVTASAIAVYQAGIIHTNHIKIKTLGGDLEVRFDPVTDTYLDVRLTGPATFVCKGEIDLNDFKF